MRIDTTRMVMMMSVIRFMPLVPVLPFFRFFYKLHALRDIEYLQIGIILANLLHPYLLEANITDLQIRFTLSDLHHLLRSRIIRFRTLPGWNYTMDNKLISCNPFSKETLRLYRHRHHLSFRQLSGTCGK